jgi:2-hydroxychromene-2-carboxylate isomerase
MAKKLEIYYDYRSPWPYIALERVYALARTCQIEMDWKPIRLPNLSP